MKNVKAFFIRRKGILGNIELILKNKGDLDNALKYLRKALEVLERFNLIYGKEIIKKAINFIERKNNILNLASFRM